MSLLTDEEEWNLWNAQGIDDMNQAEAIAFARAYAAAILAKLASAELPEPYGWAKKSEIEQHARLGGSINLWRKQYDNDTTFFTADQLRQAYAQGAASQLSAEPVGVVSDYEGMSLDHTKAVFNRSNAYIGTPLYTRREA